MHNGIFISAFLASKISILKFSSITFSQLADHGLLFAYGYVILTLTHLNVDISRNQRQANGRCGMKAHAGLK